MAISTISDRKAVTYPGAVLQVVQTSANGSVATSSSTFVTTGFSASITPTSSTSKVLAYVSGPFDSIASGNQGLYTFYRGGSDIVTGSSSGNGFGSSYGNASRVISVCTGMILDSPATTSSVTYTLYIRSAGGSPQWGTSGQTIITLMEIAA